MKNEMILNNENGVALITALMLLVLLTLLGIAATTTSTIEIMMAGNDRVYKQNLYRAESAAMLAAVEMEKMAGSKAEQNLQGQAPWIEPGTDFTQDDKGNIIYDMDAVVKWDPDNSPFTAIHLDPDKPDPSETKTKTEVDSKNMMSYAAVYKGPDGGDSWDATSNPKKYVWAIYGYSKSADGVALVELGYKKRY